MGNYVFVVYLHWRAVHMDLRQYAVCFVVAYVSALQTGWRVIRCLDAVARPTSTVVTWRSGASSSTRSVGRRRVVLRDHHEHGNRCIYASKDSIALRFDSCIHLIILVLFRTVLTFGYYMNTRGSINTLPHIFKWYIFTIW